MRMVTIPLALIIKGYKEQVAVLKLFQKSLTAGLVGNGIAQRTTETIQYGRFT